MIDLGLYICTDNRCFEVVIQISAWRQVISIINYYLLFLKILYMNSVLYEYKKKHFTL